MLRIDKVIKSWKESAALNDHINLYGQWSGTAFLTKSGDLGMVLRVVGVDYESLFDVDDEGLCFFSNGDEVIGAGEDCKLEFLLECFHLAAYVRLVDVKSFRCLTEVQLARNSEEVFELSERGNNGHKLTTRMKWSEPQISLH